MADATIKQYLSVVSGVMHTYIWLLISA